MNTEISLIEKNRKKHSGYSPEDQAIIELVDHLMDRYDLCIYQLEKYRQHDCGVCNC